MPSWIAPVSAVQRKAAGAEGGLTDFHTIESVAPRARQESTRNTACAAMHTTSGTCGAAIEASATSSVR